VDLTTLIGLVSVTGGATFVGSLPVMFHRYLGDYQWNWWESFGGGVMTGASLFSLLYPAFVLVKERGDSYLSLLVAIVVGVLFIFTSALLLKKLTENALHQRAYLFVFVMGLHNIPEGLAVGVDVAGLGWRESLPLTVAIFIQNLPEGLVSAMSFLIAGFSVRKAILANGITALIEAVSAFVGYQFIFDSRVELSFMLAFSGACMLSVVGREVALKIKGAEAASFSRGGFAIGVLVCAVLDLLL
jgi:zinc transporter, ZIP family